MRRIAARLPATHDGLRNAKFRPTCGSTATRSPRNGETIHGVPVSLRTPLCRELGIDVPILSAGMGSLAGPDLVAAVSEAGGFGVLGVSGASSEVVRERIGRTRALTERPFGVNVIIDDVGWATSEEDRELVRGEVESAVDQQVAAVVLFWGDPAPFV